MAPLLVVAAIAACSEGSEDRDNRPETSQTQSVMTEEEAALAMQACLEDLGYALGPDGSIVGRQSAEHLEDIVACLVEVEGPRVPLTEGDLQELYQVRLESKDCLEAEGYEIPDPPSLDVFIESYEAIQALGPTIRSDEDIIGPWFPHAFVSPNTGVAPSEYERLLEACPEPNLD